MRRSRFVVLLRRCAVVVLALRCGTVEADPPLVLAVAPQDVLPDELTFVYVIGEGFTADTRITFPGAGDLVDPVALLDEVSGFAQVIVGYTPILPRDDPAFPIGWKDVVATDARGTTTVEDAFYYVDFTDVYLKHCWPREVAPEGGTLAHFYGKNFRDGLTPVFYVPPDDETIYPCTDPVVLGPTEMTARLPALPARPFPDFYAGALLDGPDGAVVARREGMLAVYEGTRPPLIRRVEPAEVDARGGTPLAIHGESFDERTVVIIGDILGLDEATLVSPELITGISPGVDPLLPATPPGFNDVVVTDERGSSVLPFGLHYVDKIRSVTPREVSTAGGERVIFEGFGFEQGFAPGLGGVPLADVVYIGAERIEGTAPPLAEGANDATLTDVAGAIVGYLPAAVDALPVPPVVLEGPAEIDAVFAEGEARFVWSNPIAYDRIVATELLASGEFGRVFELPGDATSLFVAGDRDGVVLRFEGFLREGISAASLGYAFPAECERPNPLGGNAPAGKLEFPLFGGNLPRLPTRCAAGAGGPQGGPAGLDLAAEWASINGFAQVGEGYGVSVRDSVADAALATFGPHRYSNRLVTGFTLEEDADRLEIAGMYRRLHEAPGLALMGRLLHVFPDDGFEDEFTFPDAEPGAEANWRTITYYRANGDVGVEGAESCGLKIPAGDYLLQIYAVNGNPDQSYYLWRDDGRDVELLIPGAPCPPYPLVQVRDVSRTRTLPTIVDIRARQIGPQRIEFRAVGTWFDGVSPVAHSIDPADSQTPTPYVPHDFEFVWTVESAVPAATSSSHSSNVHAVDVSAIGCHRVRLTVRDRVCDRSVTVTRQAIVNPVLVNPPCSVRPYVVLNPTPDPSGIIGIAGLDPPPGRGRMARGRELSFRVLVTAESLNGCGGDPRVVAPAAGDLEFQLVWSYVDFLRFPPLPETRVALDSSKIRSSNLCGSVNNARFTYFEVVIPDLGAVRPLPIWADRGVLQTVKLQWRAVCKRVSSPDGSTRCEDPIDRSWHDVSPGFRMTNPPRSLATNHWQGFYTEAQQKYRFVHQASDQYQSHFDLGETRPVSVGLPVDGVRAQLPPMSSSYGAGLNTDIEFLDGHWRAGTARVDEGGELLGNKIRGGTLEIAASDPGLGAAAGVEARGRAQGVGDDLSYSWCQSKEIFNKAHEQELFNTLVFATVIVPPGIPITVWASVGFALKVAITAQAGVDISLFDALDGGRFVKSDLYFDSKIDLHFPASIRADALFGVVSVVMSLHPNVDAVFRAHVGNRDLELEKDINLRLFIELTLKIKICVLSFLNEIPGVGDLLCNDLYTMELLNEELIRVGDPIDIEACSTDAAGKAAGVADLERRPAGAVAGAGGGGGDLGIRLEEYFPATRSSRDGEVTLSVAYQKSDVSAIRAPITKINVRIGEGGSDRLVATRPAWELEPSIGFLSNTRALIAWTRSYPQDAIDLGATVHEDGEYTIDEINFFRAHDEIVVTPLFDTPGRPGFWDVSPDFIVSDPRDETPDPTSRRVDGRASVAGDETHDEALVAWVRIDDPAYLVPIPGSDLSRVQLEKSAIYARTVGFDGVIDAPQRVSGDGINIEPSVAFSPSGNFAYCVWVNDPIHVDLLGSNRGRNIVYSIYERETRSWSVPRPIFPDPDSLPGMLEPNIALRGDDYGLLAFTALEPNAQESDTGLLGGNRYVFISRLIDGEFGTPVRVHGKCEARVYGSQVVIGIPPRGQDPLSRVLRKWEYQVFFQGGGMPLSRASAGGLMSSGLPVGASRPTPAVALLDDGNVRSNVVAAVTSSGVHAISLNLGPSLRVIGPNLGAVAGLEPLAEGVFETTEIIARPDLSIASCSLSNRFAGPGALVTARVKIDNDGLAASAANDDGESLVGIELRYIDPSGEERVVSGGLVPVIDAGTSAELEFVIEQPLDPVRLRVTLGPNPLDASAANDVLQCALGAPEPQDFRCATVSVGGDEHETGVLLSWTNVAPYDEIYLYRDGSMCAVLPGATTSHVDRQAGPGAHEYEIRSRIEVSKSCRVAVRCAGSASSFLRGDGDSSGRLELTDAIVTLRYLFLGDRAPDCLDAADVDDSGALDISDPIRLLTYLFLGGVTLPAPGAACGEDVTADRLSCERGFAGCRDA